MSARWMICDGNDSATGPHSADDVLCLIVANEMTRGAAVWDNENRERYSVPVWCKTFGPSLEDAGLNYREVEIVKLRCGLRDGGIHTRQDISRICMLSPEQLEKIHKEIGHKLKCPGGSAVQSGGGDSPRVGAAEPLRTSAEDQVWQAGRNIGRPPSDYDSGGQVAYWVAIGAFAMLWVMAIVSCMSRPYRPGPAVPLDDFDGFDSTPPRYR